MKDAIEKKKKVIKTRKHLTEKKKKSDDNMMVGFGPNAYWRVLDPNKEIAMEPENPTFVAPHVPTIDGKDAGHVPLK